MDRLGAAGRALGDKVDETRHGTASELHQTQAKDPNEGVGTRISAGVKSLGDKVKETLSGSAKDAHKEQAKGNLPTTGNSAHTGSI